MTGAQRRHAATTTKPPRAGAHTPSSPPARAPPCARVLLRRLLGRVLFLDRVTIWSGSGQGNRGRQRPGKGSWARQGMLSFAASYPACRIPCPCYPHAIPSVKSSRVPHPFAPHPPRRPHLRAPCWKMLGDNLQHRPILRSVENIDFSQGLRPHSVQSMHVRICSCIYVRLLKRSYLPSPSPPACTPGRTRTPRARTTQHTAPPTAAHITQSAAHPQFSGSTAWFPSNSPAHRLAACLAAWCGLALRSARLPPTRREPASQSLCQSPRQSLRPAHTLWQKS